MVKREIILLFTLLVFLGCDRSYVEYSIPIDFERTNLSEDVYWETIYDTAFPEIRPDSVVIDTMAMVIGKKLDEAFRVFIEPKISFYLYGDSTVRQRNQVYYTLGKTSIQDGVISYLVSDRFDLFSLNVKDNKLKSICRISAYNFIIPEDGVYLKAYINYEAKSLLLVEKLNAGLGSPLGDHDDFWSYFGILKPKNLKYFFVTITIDENGYIQAIPFNKKDFPDYMSY